MNNVSCVCKTYTKPSSDGGMIYQKLPNELRGDLLLYLAPVDVYSLAATSQHWNKVVIDRTKKMEWSYIEGYARFLHEHVEDPNEKEKMSSISNSTKIFDSIGLVELKAANQELMKMIHGVLHMMSMDKLTALLNQSTGLPFSRDLFLFKARKQYENISKISDWCEKEKSQLNFLEALVKDGEVDLAIELILKNFSGFPERILKNVVRNGCAIQFILEFTKKSPKDWWLESLLELELEIKCTTLLKNKKINEVLAIFRCLPIDILSFLRNNVSLSLVKEGYTKEGVEIAKYMSACKEETFGEIFGYLIGKSLVDQAIQIAIEISEDAIYAELCSALVKYTHFSTAKVILNMITDEVQKETARTLMESKIDDYLSKLLTLCQLLND